MGKKKPKSKRTGRIPDLTPEVHAAIVAAVASGAPRDIVAQSVGIHRATLFAWLARGRKEKTGMYRDLSDAIKKAEAACIVDSCTLIRDAGKKHWQARAWLLERRYPGEFGLNRLELAELKKQILELKALVDARDGS